ncbi:MAG: hypothetical protein P8104_13055 [Gammaproteobacteria bacterium]
MKKAMMMSSRRRGVIGGLYAVLMGAIGVMSASSTVAQADSIVARLFFDKKPPRVGVMYAVDGNQSTITNQKIDQKEKQFDQDLYVISPGAAVTLRNSDSIDHNIYARGSEQAPGFDAGLMSPNKEKTMKLDWQAPNFERLSCKIHPKMRAYVASIPTDHFVSMLFKREGLDESYSLTVDASTHAIGLLLLGYEPVEVTLNNGESMEVELKKRNQVSGKVVFSRQ